MWTVRIVQSGKVTRENKIVSIQPKVYKRNIIRLADLELTVQATNIDKRCISIIELENSEAK